MESSTFLVDLRDENSVTIFFETTESPEYSKVTALDPYLGV